MPVTFTETEAKAAVATETAKMIRLLLAFLLFVGPFAGVLWTASGWKQSVDMKLQQLNDKVDWLVQHETKSSVDVQQTQPTQLTRRQ